MSPLHGRPGWTAVWLARRTKCRHGSAQPAGAVETSTTDDDGVKSAHRSERCNSKQAESGRHSGYNNG
eukprot:CAMPEP_0182933636 /NCGR_PEP_ID=MMETSP0105_2-20130417/34355_1 /TAXON_ID=81532 ORGANISM="Acanthoeca-like sp., Strain 10tr" /NCGR_SAMPLE_ID=MMETSP0105_2 /ASSEMBLY_ACC=CAM_ASM_000205 /LENGTH=67 /DNA_ID=CAMNT_0025072399 /DNA_START=807 /DNA_END=1010 /DNA_ORIENTATION=+